MMTPAERVSFLQRAEALGWPPVRVWAGCRTLEGRDDWTVALGSRRMNDDDARTIDEQLTTHEAQEKTTCSPSQLKSAKS